MFDRFHNGCISRFELTGVLHAWGMPHGVAEESAKVLFLAQCRGDETILEIDWLKWQSMLKGDTLRSMLDDTYNTFHVLYNRKVLVKMISALAKNKMTLAELKATREAFDLYKHRFLDGIALEEKLFSGALNILKRAFSEKMLTEKLLQWKKENKSSVHLYDFIEFVTEFPYSTEEGEAPIAEKRDDNEETGEGIPGLFTLVPQRDTLPQFKRVRQDMDEIYEQRRQRAKEESESKTKYKQRRNVFEAIERLQQAKTENKEVRKADPFSKIKQKIRESTKKVEYTKTGAATGRKSLQQQLKEHLDLDSEDSSALTMTETETDASGITDVNSHSDIQSQIEGEIGSGHRSPQLLDTPEVSVDVNMPDIGLVEKSELSEQNTLDDNILEESTLHSIDASTENPDEKTVYSVGKVQESTSFGLHPIVEESTVSTGKGSERTVMNRKASVNKRASVSAEFSDMFASLKKHRKEIKKEEKNRREREKKWRHSKIEGSPVGFHEEEITPPMSAGTRLGLLIDAQFSETVAPDAPELMETNVRDRRAKSASDIQWAKTQRDGAHLGTETADILPSPRKVVDHHIHLNRVQSMPAHAPELVLNDPAALSLPASAEKSQKSVTVSVVPSEGSQAPSFTNDRRKTMQIDKDELLRLEREIEESKDSAAQRIKRIIDEACAYVPKTSARDVQVEDANITFHKAGEESVLQIINQQENVFRPAPQKPYLKQSKTTYPTPKEFFDDKDFSFMPDVEADEEVILRDFLPTHIDIYKQPKTERTDRSPTVGKTTVVRPPSPASLYNELNNHGNRSPEELAKIHPPRPDRLGSPTFRSSTFFRRWAEAAGLAFDEEDEMPASIHLSPFAPSIPYKSPKLSAREKKSSLASHRAGGPPGETPGEAQLEHIAPRLMKRLSFADDAGEQLALYSRFDTSDPTEVIGTLSEIGMRHSMLSSASGEVDVISVNSQATNSTIFTGTSANVTPNPIECLSVAKSEEEGAKSYRHLSVDVPSQDTLDDKPKSSSTPGPKVGRGVGRVTDTPNIRTIHQRGISHRRAKHMSRKLMPGTPQIGATEKLFKEGSNNSEKKKSVNGGRKEQRRTVRSPPAPPRHKLAKNKRYLYRKPPPKSKEGEAIVRRARRVSISPNRALPVQDIVAASEPSDIEEFDSAPTKSAQTSLARSVTGGAAMSLEAAIRAVQVVEEKIENGKPESLKTSPQRSLKRSLPRGATDDEDDGFSKHPAQWITAHKESIRDLLKGTNFEDNDENEEEESDKECDPQKVAESKPNTALSLLLKSLSSNENDASGAPLSRRFSGLAVTMDVLHKVRESFKNKLSSGLAADVTAVDEWRLKVSEDNANEALKREEAAEAAHKISEERRAATEGGTVIITPRVEKRRPTVHVFEKQDKIRQALDNPDHAAKLSKKAERIEITSEGRVSLASYRPESARPSTKVDRPDLLEAMIKERPQSARERKVGDDVIDGERTYDTLPNHRSQTEKSVPESKKEEGPPSPTVPKRPQSARPSRPVDHAGAKATRGVVLQSREMKDKVVPRIARPQSARATITRPRVPKVNIVGSTISLRNATPCASTPSNFRMSGWREPSPERTDFAVVRSKRCVGDVLARQLRQDYRNNLNERRPTSARAVVAPSWKATKENAQPNPTAPKTVKRRPTSASPRVERIVYQGPPRK